MKTYKVIVITLFLAAAFACNREKRNKTEENVAIVKKLPAEQSIIKNNDTTEQPCEALIKEILITSPRYIQLTNGLDKAVVKNGGISYGISLERGPNVGKDDALYYSNTYDYIVYEIYTDRQLVVARFSFNPISKQLFEFDAVQDKLKAVDFNRDLLQEFQSVCI